MRLLGFEGVDFVWVVDLEVLRLVRRSIPDQLQEAFKNLSSILSGLYSRLSGFCSLGD